MRLRHAALSVSFASLLIAACGSPSGDVVRGRGGPARPSETGQPPDSAADSAADSGPRGESGQTGETGGSDTTPPDTSPADPCGDRAVLPTFAHGAGPVLSPATGDSDNGDDNIYAPDVVRVSDSLCLMYYGGQGGDGHDRIFLATSTDCYHWSAWPDRAAPAPIVDNGSSNHVNDPSVVLVGGTWYMYYTDASTGIDDRIHLATSSDGFTWTKQGLVLDVGPAGAWDSVKVGRPSIVYRDDTFWLYYDGQDGTARHVGLATSTDGRTFTRHPSNPLFLNAGAVDVERIEDTWVLVYESWVGSYAATSADGLSWCDQGLQLGTSGADWDTYGHVTPFVYTRDHTRIDALLFGGASDSCWCHNRIGEALPSSDAIPSDPDAGCDGCARDSDCTEACRDGGYGVEGFCAAPGSTDPAACCACVAAP
jgi:predicted GH43/DUF377 family glycosyl hydrolase